MKRQSGLLKQLKDILAKKNINILTLNANPKKKRTKKAQAEARNLKRGLLFATPLIAFLILLIILMIKLIAIGGLPAASPLMGKTLPAFSLPVTYEPKPGKGMGKSRKKLPPAHLPVAGAPFIDEGYLTNSDLIGHYSLINVFASWCATCKFEHPILIQIKDQKLLPVYGINWKDDNVKLKAWLDKSGNPYTKIGDDKNGELVLALGVTGVPETFLTSPQGVVLFHYSGVLTQDILDKEILPLVKDK